MKFGTLKRIVSDDGIGRLWLVDGDGERFAISRKLLRKAGAVRPAAGDAFESLAARDGSAMQLRRVSA
ncbi:hypothetical protein [Bradyrhizobium sp. CIR3A]|uniref:hypothetical protein n=1 Tax=Bradyrhizobium sp. CIR3A TaxID=2663838 RepID=UPI0016068E9F|nr:hypothetical protein [Bradyrhizobium sp. CIR3A]MBB4264352.1 hypothetical protein [Bradyrhizobium sp. CIR3A]